MTALPILFTPIPTNNFDLFERPPVLEGDIEVVHDEAEDYMMAGLVIDPERHEILGDSDYILGARRACKMPELFVYHHLETGKFCVAGMIFTRADLKVCVELELFDGPPGHEGAGAPDYEHLRRRTRPVHEQARENVRAMRDRASLGRALKEDSLREKIDKGKSLIRRGFVAEGTSLRDGHEGFVGTREGGTALADAKVAIREIAHEIEKGRA